VGGFCLGPLNELKPANTAQISLTNNQQSPVYNQSWTLSKTYADFQIRAREEGPQDEGIVWKTGAVYLR
jgi:hypothetical protein